jgi:hypothetical protein
VPLLQAVMGDMTTDETRASSHQGARLSRIHSCFHDVYVKRR